MNRRTMLTTLGAGAALVLGGGYFMLGRGGLVRGDLADSGLPQRAAPGLDLTGTQILYYASLAPSGHNAPALDRAPGRARSLAGGPGPGAAPAGRGPG